MGTSDSFTGDLAALFRRDLSLLHDQIEAFPDDPTLWRTLPGITNAPGNLVLHLEGNLREYVGRQLGNVPYSRVRDLEFSARGIGREDLAARIADLATTIPAVVENLSTSQLETDYPQKVLERVLSTRHFLIHLFGHLNWHLGQIDYARRILTGDGAVPRPSL
jgi:hypothetical protein